MSEINFADRYAEIGLAPTAAIVTARSAPAARIIEDAPNAHIIAMVQAYFDIPGADLEWLRKEFVQEDVTFSLVNNGREVRLLCAAILAELVKRQDEVTMLSLSTAYAGGRRSPPEFGWLVTQGASAMAARAVLSRAPQNIDPKVAHTVVPKLQEEIAATPSGDWTSLLTILGKIRHEALSSARITSAQATKALTELDRQVQLQREENQMLWWIVGGHSRTLTRPFEQLTQNQAAIVSAVDLGDLTTTSKLGPVAAGAMLERMIGVAKKPRGQSPKSLSTIVDSADRDDLKLMNLPGLEAPANIAIATTAVDLARNLGAGSWQNRFEELTGISANIELDLLALAELLYREQLLGQLL